MSAADQTQLIGEASGDYVEIQTNGRVIRPLLAIPTALVDEFKLTIDQEGLRSRATDPANVGLYRFEAPAAAFEEFHLDGEEFTAGINADVLESQLRDARLGEANPDPVALTIDATHTRVEIQREYDHSTVRRRGEMLNIDTDSIRKQPDVPDGDFQYRAEVDVRALDDLTDHLNAVSDHVRLGEQSGDVLVRATGDDGDDDQPLTATEAEIDGAAEPLSDDAVNGASSLFSLDYWMDVVDGLASAKVDTVTFEWGDDFLILFSFERTDHDGAKLYDGEFMIAPRMPNEGP